jgi:hypothetical protein
VEQRARDAIAEQHAQNIVPENPVLLRSVFSEQNLDPALHQEDDAVRAQYCLRLLGSEEHSDSKGSSSSDDSDDSDDEDADKDEEDNGKDAEEGNNNDTVKDSQDFGWGEVGQHQKEHPGKYSIAIFSPSLIQFCRIFRRCTTFATCSRSCSHT